MFRKSICVILSVLLIFGSLMGLSVSAENNTAVPTTENITDSNASSGYEEYLSALTAEKELSDGKVGISNYIPKNGAEFGEYGEKSNVYILSNANSSLEFTADVEKDGFYQVFITYTGCVDVDKDIKLSLSIDGQLPFVEAGTLELNRCYENSTNKFETDSIGNQQRPKQVQKVYWQTVPLFQNDIGTTVPYMFYLFGGSHTLELTAQNGGVCIQSIEIRTQGKTIPYSEYKKSSEKVADAKSVIIEGEKADRKSSISLYPMTDRTNCATYPFSEKCTMLNTIGGSNWSMPGQWIEWDFDVEKDGIYYIDLRVRQNANQGMKCYRTIFIDGEIPFSELASYGFLYNRSWYIERLKDENSNAYGFYLTAGKHTIRLETTTGDLYEPLNKVNSLVTELNDMYHNIIMITGTSPDTYRDYNLEKAIPGLVENMKSLAKRLDDCMNEIKSVTGGSGTQAVSLTTLSDQLRELAKHPKSISDRVSNFYSNISAVSAWVNSALAQPLEIDRISVDTKEKPELKANAGFFSNLVSSFKSFAYSFVVDYDVVGDDSKNADITVWVSSGREQAESLKQLIDRDFAKQSDISVSLKLVQTGVVEAVVAGTGPDVLLNANMTYPVDFASRKILEPLDGFDGFEEHFKQNFSKNATIPFVYRDRVYALPETQEFNMMFYREDIFNQLGLSVPETWDDVSSMMAILARNNMQVGIPSLTSTSAGVINTSFPNTVVTLFLQNNINFYSDDLRTTNLKSTESVGVFQTLTDFYNKFGLPIYYDASNRFRTGEMPIIIAPLSTYNALNISAPEIQGRWKMAKVPGTRQKDGTINRADEYTATSCIMFKSAKKKQDCWEFIKWWTSGQTQYDYGMELEAVLGISGRYMTANINAFERLPWDSATSAVIKEQWKEVATVPQVPGYYFVSRYLTNAISDTIVNGDNAQVVIDRYADTINAELERKNKQLDKLWNE